MAPGICTEGEGSPSRGWLNQRVLAVLQGFKEANQFWDYPRIRYLQQDPRDLLSKLSVPLHVLGTIVVPNLLSHQNAAIHRVKRNMVAAVAGRAWEKQAIGKATRVVRSNQRQYGPSSKRRRELSMHCPPAPHACAP